MNTSHVRSSTLLFCLLLLLSFTAFGSEARSLPDQDTLQKLANQQQWRHLLHYHRAGLFSANESQIDSADFFLSPRGKTDPLAELIATLDAFLHGSEADDPAQCRLPARYAWLSTQLGPGLLPPSSCAKFDHWREQVDAEKLTLIFPAAYLNSPSSMFGHTLIRIDRKDGNNPLLDYSVNFAANAKPDDNELLFTYKGLSGGYPGVFSILPYYQKVTEYSFLEARDVWEYELDLAPEEVEQFVRHVWEVKDSYLDYYFFNENCSYQLLTLIDAASERFDFASQFFSHAIPADTVRVLGQGKLFKRAKFRPSTLTQLESMRSELPNELRNLSKQLADTGIALEDTLAQHSLSATERAQTLELAYHYSRYLAVRKKQLSPELGARSMALLSARSKIDDTAVFAPPATPGTRDDEGHFSHRVQLGLGSDKNTDYALLGFRAAYHDWLDPLPGYIPGARLEMGHLTLRHTFEDIDETQVDSFTLIDIASLSPRNELISPVSWRVATGLHRLLAPQRPMSAYLNGGGGLSYRMGSQQVFALAELSSDVDDDLKKGYRIAAGPRLGWIAQQDTWSAGIELSHWFDVLGAEFAHQQAKLKLSWHFDRHQQIRIESQYQHFELSLPRGEAERHYTFDQRISWMLYF